MYSSNGIDQRFADLTLRPSVRGTDTYSLSGRTQVNPSSLPLATTWLYIAAGQSNANNSINGTYSPTNSAHLYDLSLAHRGALFRALEPLLCSEQTQGHHALSLCDGIISDGVSGKVTDIVMMNAAFGGSYYADFVVGGGTVGGTLAGTVTGDLAYRHGLAARLIAAAGLTRPKRVINLIQGEWDSDNVATPQATVSAHIASQIANMKNVGLLRTGDVLFVTQTTRLSNTSTNRNQVRNAQATAPDGSLVRSLCDLDTLDTGYRYDGVHFNNTTGRSALLALMKPGIINFMQNG